MNELTFTTGQMSGMTLITHISLYRYVRDFQEFFSDTAKQHKKGRRWTVNDLEVIQAIRYLYHERANKENIRKELSAGWRPAIKTAYDIETMSRLLNQTFTYIDEAKRMLAESSQALHLAKIENQSNQALRNKIHYLTDRLNEIDRELIRLKFYLQEPHSQKRRDKFYSTWQQFRKDLRDAWNEEEPQKG